MGRQGDEILVESLADRVYRREAMRWVAMVEERFGPGPEVVERFSGKSGGEAAPWGWSAYAVRRLLKAGVTDSMIDRAGIDIARVREISHRRSSIAVTEAVLKEIDFDEYGLEKPDVPYESRSFDEVMGLTGHYKDGIYLKSPWSSSGRGVVKADLADMGKYRGRIDGTIKSQGSVMVERAYDKTADFAMLFHSDGGKVRFVGYSRFFNARTTAYGGNMLASDGKIKTDLGELLFSTDSMTANLFFERLEAVFPAILTRILSGDNGRLCYKGYLGVDMMVTRDSCGSPMIVPCVELNLRMTMGVVAHELYRRVGEGTMSMTAGAGVSGADVDLLQLIPSNPYFSMVVSR